MFRCFNLYFYLIIFLKNVDILYLTGIAETLSHPNRAYGAEFAKRQKFLVGMTLRLFPCLPTGRLFALLFFGLRPIFFGGNLQKGWRAGL